MKHPENYTHNDAIGRYKLQDNVQLRWQEYKDYTKDEAIDRQRQDNIDLPQKEYRIKNYEFIVGSSVHGPFVPDQALYKKDFDTFEKMLDSEFFYKWPLFKEGKDSPLQKYFYGDQLHAQDMRFNNIKEKKKQKSVNDFMRDYQTLKIESITESSAQKFFNTHQNIITECSLQENDPIAKILLNGCNKPEKDQEKAFILYAVLHKKYEYLVNYKKRCHANVQKSIVNATTITSNKSTKKNDTKKSSETSKSSPKKVNNVKKPTSNKTQNNKNFSKGEVEKGISALRNGQLEEAVPLLLKNIDYAVQKLEKKDREKLSQHAKIIREKEVSSLDDLTDVDQDTLYLHGKIAESGNNGTSTNILWKLGLMKGLLLELEKESPLSVVYGNEKTLFEPFYNIKPCQLNTSDVIEKKIASRINNGLSKDPHSFFCLLAALPFAGGKYYEDFLNSFFDSENNQKCAKQYNVIPQVDLCMTSTSRSFFESLQPLGYKQSFSTLMFQNIYWYGKYEKEYHKEYHKEESEEKKNKLLMIKEQFSEKINNFLKLESELKSKTSLLWYTLLKKALFRLGVYLISNYEEDFCKNSLAKFNIKEFFLRKITKNPKFKREEAEELLNAINNSDNSKDGFFEKTQLLVVANLLKTNEYRSRSDEVKKIFLTHLCHGVKPFFESCIKECDSIPLSLLHVNDIIATKEQKDWPQYLGDLEKKTLAEKHTSISPLLYALIATDLKSPMTLKLGEDSRILLTSDRCKDKKTQFSLVQELIEKGMHQATCMPDDSNIYYRLLERIFGSLLYLSYKYKNDKEYDIVREIINEMQQKCDCISSSDTGAIKNALMKRCPCHTLIHFIELTSKTVPVMSLVETVDGVAKVDGVDKFEVEHKVEVVDKVEVEEIYKEISDIILKKKK